jgi:hypothetical protein
MRIVITSLLFGAIFTALGAELVPTSFSEKIEARRSRFFTLFKNTTAKNLDTKVSVIEMPADFLRQSSLKITQVSNNAMSLVNDQWHICVDVFESRNAALEKLAASLASASSGRDIRAEDISLKYGELAIESPFGVTFVRGNVIASISHVAGVQNEEVASRLDKAIIESRGIPPQKEKFVYPNDLLAPGAKPIDPAQKPQVFRENLDWLLTLTGQRYFEARDKASGMLDAKLFADSGIEKLAKDGTHWKMSLGATGVMWPFAQQGTYLRLDAELEPSLVKPDSQVFVSLGQKHWKEQWINYILEMVAFDAIPAKIRNHGGQYDAVGEEKLPKAMSELLRASFPKDIFEADIKLEPRIVPVLIDLVARTKSPVVLKSCNTILTGTGSDAARQYWNSYAEPWRWLSTALEQKITAGYAAELRQESFRFWGVLLGLAKPNNASESSLKSYMCLAREDPDESTRECAARSLASVLWLPDNLFENWKAAEKNTAVLDALQALRTK